MLKLILSRIGQGLIVLVVVSALTFALLAAAGGDALTALAAEPHVSASALVELRRIYGLDDPLLVRHARWLAEFARGHMGYSISFHAPVSLVILPRLLRTLFVAALALLLAWAIALALGVQAARKPGSIWDRASEVVILLSASTPRIVVALIALAVAARTNLFTIGGAFEASAPLSLARALAPAIVLAAPLVALFLAQTRESLRAALAEDFVRVARAKGLPERTVIFRHAMRAALNPLITIFGYSLGSVVGGSIVAEYVLGWQGIGSLSVVAVVNRDVPLLMGVVMTTATAVLLGNLIADVLLRLNDPRLRLEDGGRGNSSTRSTSTTTTA
ncbi:MAG: peptide/nickel transport system permease protein [Acidobacteriota bacterium]|nr:peptide/nickel transport system permease protein [Acidobacteriota bacterium]